MLITYKQTCAPTWGLSLGEKKKQNAQKPFRQKFHCVYSMTELLQAAEDKTSCQIISAFPAGLACLNPRKSIKYISTEVERN